MDLFSFDKPKLTLKPPIRLFEAFAGVGTQAMAIKRITPDVIVVGISEIDKYAIQSYMAIHGETKNYGDITKINGKDLPEIDILTWSFSCTDLSKAGRQQGLDGTRSGLGYQIPRIIGEMDIKPRVLLMENVPDLLSPKFRDGWHKIYNEIESMGYHNHVRVLNARDYGVAQNRNRVFMVSIMGDYAFDWPVKETLNVRLRDYLESAVDPKYYLSDKLVSYFKRHIEKHQSMGHGFNFKPKSADDVANTVTARPGQRPDDNYVFSQGVKTPSCRKAGDVNLGNNESNNRVYDVGGMEKTVLIPEATKQGYALAEEGDGVYLGRPHQKCGSVQHGMIPTIKTQGNGLGVVQGMKIRKLTPKECWRLMDIRDSDFDKAGAVCSDTQLYKQAGNAIVVGVLEKIFRGLIGVSG